MIDYGSSPPIPAFKPPQREHLANYRRVYGASEAAVKDAQDACDDPLGDWLATYERLGAEHVVVKARDLETTFGLKIHNEDVATFCADHGPRYIGFAGVDPNKGMHAMRELEHAIRELGLRGLNLQCFENKLRINDAKLYPLYAKCIELDVPVNIHASINFSTHTLMDYGRPACLDEVMVHFPELRVVASPPGWPWVQELIGVAWRHENVHIGLVAVRPKYLDVANSGYEPLLQYGNTILADRIIFGSAWPMQPVERAIDEVRALPLKDGVAERWLALGRIGAVMVPVNVRYRAHDLDYVINDAHVRWMVVHRDCLASVASMAHRPVALTDTHMVVLDGQGATSPHHDYSALLAGGDPGFEPPQAVGAQDLMNIQYTSGTTGFPKGCMLRQCYWTATAKIAARRDGIRYHNILAAQPFYYMDPQWLMLMAFYHRGTVHVAAQPSATRFMGWVREHHIHFCIFPEVVYRQPPDARDADNALRRVNVYGLRASVHADLEGRFNVRARECFGMTEIGATLFTPLEAAHMVGSGSCGIPGPWREARVVDDDGHDVPRGEIGELVVRGPNIFLRYYEEPEANAESFFGDWFRTGDLFRQDDDGWFFLVGRKKDMVRRSGENIAAREVEAVLVSIDGIADAAVLGVPDSMRGEEVKAYIVLDESVSADTLPPVCIAELTGEQLAAFKVPRYFEYVAELPRTPSMKIAKGVLREAKADLRKGSFDRVNGVWL